MSNLANASLADQIEAQQDALNQTRQMVSTNNIGNNTGWWSTKNAMTMSASVLLFGAFVLVVLLRHIKNNDIMENEAKLFMISLIVWSTLFLVVSGYGDTQIAPVMGLFGTVIGYILRGSGEIGNIEKTERSSN